MTIGTEPSGNANCIEVSIDELRCGINLLTDNDAELTANLLNYAVKAWEKEAKAQLQVKKGNKSVLDAVLERTARHEARRHYRALRRNMRKAGVKKHACTSAHHIVSWRHPQAKAARDILRKVGIDIDAEINGVYLPRYQKDLPHPNLPQAYAHSKVHTDNYYLNITSLLAGELAAGGGKDEIEGILRFIGQGLADGSFPLTETLG